MSDPQKYVSKLTEQDEVIARVQRSEEDMRLLTANRALKSGAQTSTVKEAINGDKTVIPSRTISPVMHKTKFVKYDEIDNIVLKNEKKGKSYNVQETREFMRKKKEEFRETKLKIEAEKEEKKNAAEERNS